MISCKIYFQLMVTVFKESLNLYLLLIFCSSLMCVFETGSILDQVAEHEALLEISEKCITKLNVFSYIIFQFRLKIVWKIL